MTWTTVGLNPERCNADLSYTCLGLLECYSVLFVTKEESIFSNLPSKSTMTTD